MAITQIKSISARKQEILEAAQRLFSQKGYQAASMRDLADDLDIKPASLYSHYRSKDEILWEIAVRCAKEFHETVLPIAQEDISIEGKIRLMIQAHVAVIIKNIEASAIFFREWKHLEEPRKSEYSRFISRYNAVFSDLIREGHETGIFRRVKSKFTTSMMISSLNWIHLWYKPDGEMTPQDIGLQASEFVLGGILQGNQV